MPKTNSEGHVASVPEAGAPNAPVKRISSAACRRPWASDLLALEMEIDQCLPHPRRRGQRHDPAAPARRAGRAGTVARPAGPAGLVGRRGRGRLGRAQYAGRPMLVLRNGLKVPGQQEPFATRESRRAGLPDLVRIAILGAGAMGATHAAAYAGISGVSVAGVFSRDAVRLNKWRDCCTVRPSRNVRAANWIERSGILQAIDERLPAHRRPCCCRDRGAGGKETCLLRNAAGAGASTKRARCTMPARRAGRTPAGRPADALPSVAYARIKAVATSGRERTVAELHHLATGISTSIPVRRMPRRVLRRSLDQS